MAQHALTMMNALLKMGDVNINVPTLKEASSAHVTVDTSCKMTIADVKMLMNVKK